jgi:hypothetical protein
MRVGRRFYIEYAENVFTGRVEVDVDISANDHMTLDVELIESSSN